MSDLQLDKSYRKGDRGNKVKLIQEWLCLHGFHLTIDKTFGPATDRAVKEFQKTKRLKQDGVVGPQTFGRLIQPMTTVLKNIAADGKSQSQLVVAYAEQHLAQHPREIGGQNMGPWVRFYMKGHEGAIYPWCAGFVSYILKQASDTLSKPLSLRTSFSCDVLAGNAKRKGIFLAESQLNNDDQIEPGYIFLQRKTALDWVHTGIVIAAANDYFQTIEGNTNDEGSREGYEVCKRFRGYKKKDFIRI